MKSLVNDPFSGVQLGRTAQSFVKENFNPNVIGIRYRERLEQIGALPGKSHWRGANATKSDGGDRIVVNLDRPARGEEGDFISLAGYANFEGWAVAESGIASVCLETEGSQLTVGSVGNLRPDIGAIYPEWPKSERAGFLLRWNTQDLNDGFHNVRIVAKDTRGNSNSIAFPIEVSNARSSYELWFEEQMAGKADNCTTVVPSKYADVISFVILFDPDGKSIEQLRTTIRSLTAQTSGGWELVIGLRAKDSRLIETLCSMDPRIVAQEIRGGAGAAFAETINRSAGTFIGLLQPGDVLHKRTVATFAETAATYFDCDLIYSDHEICHRCGRRLGFLKPDWSPLFLANEDYIGIAWVGRSALVKSAASNHRQLDTDFSYQTLLAVSQDVRAAYHVPAVLYSLDGEHERARKTSVAKMLIPRER